MEVVKTPTYALPVSDTLALLAVDQTKVFAIAHAAWSFYLTEHRAAPFLGRNTTFPRLYLDPSTVDNAATS